MRVNPVMEARQGGHTRLTVRTRLPAADAREIIPRCPGAERFARDDGGLNRQHWQVNLLIFISPIRLKMHQTEYRVLYYVQGVR